MQHNTLERGDTSTLQEYVTSILPDSFRPNFGEDLDLHRPLDLGQEPPCLWPDETDGDFNLRFRAEANHNPDDLLWSVAGLDLGSRAEASHNPDDLLWSAAGLDLGSRAEASHNANGESWSASKGDLNLETNYNSNGHSWSPANSGFNLRCDTDDGGPIRWADSALAEPTCSRKPERNSHSLGEKTSTATNCGIYNQRSFGLWDEELHLDRGLQLTDGPLLLDSGDSCSSSHTAEFADAPSTPPAAGRKGYRHRHARKYLSDEVLQKERNRELNNEASALYRKRKKEAASKSEDHLQHLQQENDHLCNKLQLLTVQSDWCHDVYVKYNDYFAPSLDGSFLP